MYCWSKTPSPLVSLTWTCTTLDVEGLGSKDIHDGLSTSLSGVLQ